jgi:acetyl esterase/lipase
VKRFLLWVAGSVAALVVAVIVAFQVSPWPTVMLIGQIFAGNDTAAMAALARHVPAGIVSRTNLRYGSGPDETFDLNYPEGASGLLPAIVWVHGGAWISGSKEGVANYPKILAAPGYATVAFEYARGPGTTYPKPVEQVNAALAHLVAHAAEYHVDPGAIVLAGDSAGAQITAQIAIITTDPAYAAKVGIVPALSPRQLRAVMLLSGAYDIGGVDLDGKGAWFMRAVLWAYSGVRNFLDDEQFRLLSVTNYVTAAFPRTFISSGNDDALEPQAVALADKLTHLGVSVDSLFFASDYTPPLPHEYQFNLDNDAGRAALARSLAFLKDVFEK